MAMSELSSDRTPDPPGTRSQRRQLITLIVVVLAISVPILYLWLFADGPEPRPQLCDLLRDGWTPEEIVNNDQWRDWPDSMSRLQRSAAVIDEASRNCPKLIGF